MLDRMIRFLHSIGIEDYENYDLDFDKIRKSQFLLSKKIRLGVLIKLIILLAD